MIKRNEIRSYSYLVRVHDLNYESWAPKCMGHLLAYPGPWEWLRNGEEPQFITPPLEIPRVEQRRQVQAGARGRGNGGGRGAGGRRARDKRRARGLTALAEEEDEDKEDADEVRGREEEIQMVHYSRGKAVKSDEKSYCASIATSKPSTGTSSTWLGRS